MGRRATPTVQHPRWLLRRTPTDDVSLSLLDRPSEELAPSQAHELFRGSRADLYLWVDRLKAKLPERRRPGRRPEGREESCSSACTLDPRPHKRPMPLLICDDPLLRPPLPPLLCGTGGAVQADGAVLPKPRPPAEANAALHTTGCVCTDSLLLLCCLLSLTTCGGGIPLNEELWRSTWPSSFALSSWLASAVLRRHCGPGVARRQRGPHLRIQ